MKSFDYRSLIGSLERVAQSTRPDVQRAVLFCASFQSNPSTTAKKWALRILQYLVTTRHETLRWWGPVPGRPAPHAQLVVHTDADFASCPKTSKSYSGITFALDGNGAPFDWVSERQSSVAKCNNRAEAIALSRAMEETHSYYVPFLAELGTRDHKALILSDSQPSVNKLDQFSSRTRTRAENVMLSRSREIMRKNQTVLGWCDTDAMHADALMKRVTTSTLARLVMHLLGQISTWYSGGSYQT